MDFRLTDEQLAFQKTCHDFAAEVIRPVADHYDREQEVPWDVLREARRRDMYGLELIQQFATDGMSAVLYAEEIHWGCAGIALALSASSLAAAGIASAGLRGSCLPSPSAGDDQFGQVPGMNWAIPMAPAGETIVGLKPDS